KAQDAFSGTARYYANFRIPYPEQLLSRLRESANITGNGELLDLGCGTGEIAVPMSRYFRKVTGVDLEPEMIQQAKLRAEREQRKNVRWCVASAEDLDAPPHSFELVTIGAAFHWM